MSKNTIIRFPEQMTMNRALNHNMNWTVRQLRTLTRITNGLNNGLLCVSLGLGMAAVLIWELMEENRLLAKEVDKLQKANSNLVDDIDKVHERLEALEEGRTQM